MARTARRKEIPGFVHWLRARRYRVDETARSWQVGAVTISGREHPMFHDPRTGDNGAVLMEVPLQRLFDDYALQQKSQRKRQKEFDVE